MDWYTIQYLYTESYNRFVKTMFPNIGVISVSTLFYYDTKKLYQFFDKEGIYLTVEMYNPNRWVYTISLGNGFVYGPTMESKTTREEIESDGFYECFKVLDKLIRVKV